MDPCPQPSGQRLGALLRQRIVTVYFAPAKPIPQTPLHLSGAADGPVHPFGFEMGPPW